MGEAREPPLGDRGSSGSVDRDSCNMGRALTLILVDRF